MYTIMIENGYMNRKREKAHPARINYVVLEIFYKQFTFCCFCGVRSDNYINDGVCDILYF